MHFLFWLISRGIINHRTPADQAFKEIREIFGGRLKLFFIGNPLMLFFLISIKKDNYLKLFLSLGAAPISAEVTFIYFYHIIYFFKRENIFLKNYRS